jgi:predicted ArsR family transcriptional regulator
MKLTTRLRILEHLRKNQTTSVRELSLLLGTSGANIRHHLGMLESNDLIEVIGQRNEGPGRPQYVYGLSRRMLGDGLDSLTAALLNTWMEEMEDRDRMAALRSVAAYLAGLVEIDLPMTKRLVKTVERMNELHYLARWEASALGPRLTLGHCPYAAIIDSHPQLCQMDAFLMEIRLGSPVEQTAKLQISAIGLPFCAFRIISS